METEHTLGPWTMRGTTSDGAHVVTGWANGLWATIEGPNDETRLANARLIAAAPCLLAALQRLAHPMAEDDDLENALEVLARATGAP